MMIAATWCVMPVLAGPEMTEVAIGDLLVQSVPTKILVVNQGVDEAFRDRLERLSEQDPARIFLWHHQPPLPSLSATWNLALDTIWIAGGLLALVVNNDVRLHPDTVLILTSELRRKHALFVSAVGVRGEQFKTSTPLSYTEPDNHGGPDFSCFVISKACHEQFRFDERFIPAFCEDLDYHRRLMLAGEGRRIFSVNVPYLHLASQTLAQLPSQEANRIRLQVERQSRAYYAQKWGGPVNEETYQTPFGPVATEDVTTPTIQRKVREMLAFTTGDPAYLQQQGNYQPPGRRPGSGRLHGRPLDDDGNIEFLGVEDGQVSRGSPAQRSADSDTAVDQPD